MICLTYTTLYELSGICVESFSTLLPRIASVGIPANVSMETTAASLPSSVSSQLTNVTLIGVTATVFAGGAAATTFTVRAQTAGEILPSPLTELPAINTGGTVTFDKAGTGYVDVPPAAFAARGEDGVSRHRRVRECQLPGATAGDLRRAVRLRDRAVPRQHRRIRATEQLTAPSTMAAGTFRTSLVSLYCY